MPNHTAMLRDEARQSRDQFRRVCRAALECRQQVAGLRRDLKTLQVQLAAITRRLASLEKKPRSAMTDETVGFRFSPRSVRAQRKRLGLSAADYGRLVGVSAQAVYHWERGQSRPQRAQFKALIALRSLGRREAQRRLAQFPSS